MESISGYVRILASVRVEQEQTKPLFGKPHLKLGQCIGLWGYFFQLGAVLGARHSSNLDAFGPAFLGAAGPPGAVRNFFDQVAMRIASEAALETTTFTSYVVEDYSRRAGSAADLSRLIAESGMKKIPSSTAAELAWQYAQCGAAVGAIDSMRAQAMFELSHRGVSKEQWDRAHSAGLAIPKEQDNLSYAEVEQEENQGFLAYCQQCCPEFHAALSMD